MEIPKRETRILFRRPPTTRNPKDFKRTAPGCESDELPWVRRRAPRNPEGVAALHTYATSSPHASVAREIVLHVVFSTKERRPFLRDLDLGNELRRLLERYQMAYDERYGWIERDERWNSFGVRSERILPRVARRTRNPGLYDSHPVGMRKHLGNGKSPRPLSQLPHTLAPQSPLAAATPVTTSRSNFDYLSKVVEEPASL